ncbi:Uncharacterized conserved protein, DUF2147 family [Zunongwangia mangrovi]|uniref:Uncharacterized conserved protein, DUF2147 family n=1 Tax=Zunongwangia mangrovi TaxID=1334022 RepID=A0A1I1GCR6_9FLAO|nr:DUF2147 domain-containing protein [Zunongwangia mangrovi]SFC09285.1 Uncharacterized conserved protein, DUF2147 family [Zunongwangia mangrovi]
MKKYILFSVFFIAFAALNSVYAQDDVFGKWKCTNDEGKVNSIVKIFKKEDGEVCGKVLRITKEEDRDKLCTECKGALKDKPIEGLQLMHGLKKEGDHYAGGEIINPKSGKVYKVKIWVDEDNPDMLNVRGYVAFFYKTMTWERAE